MKNENCNSCGAGFLLTVLEAGVPALCPACGPLYSIAKNVSNSNNFSNEIRSLAGFACAVTLIFIGAIYFDKLLDSLKKV